MFRFKKFVVSQQQSAMKVGTDGVLLGAWADIRGCKRVVDVGAGTGLISLMIAQRCPASIVAVEIDKLSAEEAANNIAASPWNSRISIVNVDFNEWTSETTDLIVSNPPFYVEDVVAPDSRRALARHQDSLSVDLLLKKSSLCLSDSGSVALIVPASREQEITYLASVYALHVGRLTRVYPNPHKCPNRILVQLYKKNVVTEISDIFIRNNDNEYSSEYKYLTSEFYLNF